LPEVQDLDQRWRFIMTVKDYSLGSLILFVGLPFFLGCQGNPVGPGQDMSAPPEQILSGGSLELIILPGNVDLAVGGQFEFALCWVDGEEVYDDPRKVLEWTSEDSGIASVSRDGLVQGLASGTVRITVEVEGAIAEALVTVRES
jgi:hypothetical protein